jgi:hypothetical protein
VNLAADPDTKFDILRSEFHAVKNRGWIFMSIDGRDIREIGIWLLLLAFAFVAIILSLLFVDAPYAITGVTFTLILILEILFVFSFNPQAACRQTDECNGLRRPAIRAAGDFPYCDFLGAIPSEHRRQESGILTGIF